MHTSSVDAVCFVDMLLTAVPDVHLFVFLQNTNCLAISINVTDYSMEEYSRIYEENVFAIFGWVYSTCFSSCAQLAVVLFLWSHWSYCVDPNIQKGLWKVNCTYFQPCIFCENLVCHSTQARTTTMRYLLQEQTILFIIK